MGDQEHGFDRWTIPLLMLWALFFVSGLFPGITFQALREAGWVTTQRALVNSPFLLTTGYAFYLAHFAFHRAREAGGSPWVARIAGFYVFVLGLIAFFDFPIQVVIFAPSLLRSSDGYVLLMVGAIKMIAWLVLYGMVLRYYAMGNRRVFADLVPQRSMIEEPEADSGEAIEKQTLGENSAGR